MRNDSKPEAVAEPKGRPVGTIATWRLYLLRSGYLLITLGMGLQMIPTFMTGGPWELQEGVVNAMLLALVVLCALGLRSPLKMLPVLFWEIAWKTIWLGAVALPDALGAGLDPAAAETAFACALVIIIYAVVPWDYVWRQYVVRSDDSLAPR